MKHIVPKKALNEQFTNLDHICVTGIAGKTLQLNIIIIRNSFDSSFIILGLQNNDRQVNISHQMKQSQQQSACSHVKTKTALISFKVITFKFPPHFSWKLILSTKFSFNFLSNNNSPSLSIHRWYNLEILQKSMMRFRSFDYYPAI